MTFTRTAACTLAVAFAGAGAAAAQDAPTSAVDRSQLRHQIYVMEGALARAVEFGAQSLNREIRAVMPGGFVLAGQAHARGVYLEGYGIFFDVEVPIMRETMMWSLRTILDQDAAGLKKALADLRQLARTAPDPAVRAAGENAINRLELQLGPMSLPGGTNPNPFAAAIQSSQQSQGDLAATGVAPQAQRVQSGAPVEEPAQPSEPARPNEESAQEAPTTLPIDKPWMRDPNRAYTQAVQRALVDAMIDFSAPMTIEADEWLTVAARDNYPRDSLAPPDPLEEVETILLRIKGAELMAYRAGKIDRDEARRRVVISGF